MKETDAALVLATLKGDKSAFGKLYDRYARLVRAVCYDTTKDVGQAEDMAQDVFLRAYQKLNRLEEPEKFGAWLVSFARNVCREYRRGKVRDRLMPTGLAPEERHHPTAESPDEQIMDLREALGRLDEEERMAVHVFYLQEKDLEEAKKILQVSRSGLYRLLARARKKLERYLEIPDDEPDNRTLENETY